MISGNALSVHLTENEPDALRMTTVLQPALH